jgi:hypothetical protein
MDTTLQQLAIQLPQSVIFAVIGFFILRDFKKRDSFEQKSQIQNSEILEKINGLDKLLTITAKDVDSSTKLVGLVSSQLDVIKDLQHDMDAFFKRLREVESDVKALK